MHQILQHKTQGVPNDTSKGLGLMRIKECNLPSETVLWNLLPGEVLDANFISS